MSAEKGKHLIKIDQWYASSKTCNHCGHKVDEINQKTELEVKFEYDKKTQVCSFFVVKSA